MFQWSKGNDVLGTMNRGNAAESGLCTLCRADCAGKCETWSSCLKGRQMLYPRDFGLVTAGSANTTHVGVNYNALRIQGYNYGAKSMNNGRSNSADDCLFTNVSIETAFGNGTKTKARMPLMTGALGSTFIASKYWNSFAIGCALVGIPIVVGENVVGVDLKSSINKGKIKKSPELDRRVETYMRYHDGYGAIIVQLNVEDARNGVAEYVIDKYGDKVFIELKWGQGAKNIGGEIEVSTLDYALFLKKRGYLLDPDPELEEVQAAYRAGHIKGFARHSRLGYTDLTSAEAVEASFLENVARLRSLGFKRISLKTGSYGMQALAMAIKYASEAGLDLLTIDGAGGGTGMSPWNMMETWGVPSILLHSKAWEYASLLASRSRNVVDLSFAGGLAREDHIFKALALGAPFTKAVCMGRALMIPGMVGKNIGRWLNGEDGGLPSTVSKFGSTKEEIFVCYEDLKAKYGKEINNFPLGAIGIYSAGEKLRVGLQQLMAGARKWRTDLITRKDLAALTEECAKVTGITYIMDAYRDEALAIIDGAENGQVAKIA